jgi:ubiquinone/menaquinone biosynthesis C-methylase UbiE
VAKPFEELLAGLKAVAEPTRVRILFALSHGELNVSELMFVLRQSQPRVSRHLRLMTDAGLLSRHKEGNWVLFRLRAEGLGGALAQSIVDMLPGGEGELSEDLRRLQDVSRDRKERAQAYFSANAAKWSELRSLHVEEESVEGLMRDMVGNGPIDTLVDLGTGTGRLLELFGDQAHRLVGVDSSRDMLAVARDHLSKVGEIRAEFRLADIYALPLEDESAEVVTIHQVLHFLDEPQKALLEARRVLKSGGRLLIVDFAPHNLEELRQNHAHRRLGISAEQMSHWLARAGLLLTRHEVLDPPWRKDGRGLTVSLWLATPRSEAPLARIRRMAATP